MGISNYTTRSHLVVAALSAAVTGLLFIAGTALHDRHSASSPKHEAATAPVPAPSNSSIRRSAGELISEKALRVRAAIRRGDFAAARRISGEVLSRSRLRSWDYYPFSDFIENIADVNDPGFEARLDQWVSGSRNDAIPVLIRGRYYLDMAWFTRGTRFAKEIQAGKLKSFTDYQTKALADAETAIRLNDGNPYAYFLSLDVLSGGGASKELLLAFDRATTKYPGYYPLYTEVLGALRPEWGGSVDAMYAFVDRYAGNAPSGSSLKLLYLKLYANVLGVVSAPCWQYSNDEEETSKCRAFYMARFFRPALQAHVAEALALYDHADRYQFNKVAGPILSSMMEQDGGGKYSSDILELAASSLHTSTQLKPDRPVEPNYMIDKAVAASWYMKGHYENALTKNLSALKAAQAATYPSAEEKDLQLAGIYEQLGTSYNQLHLYADMIESMKAVVSLKGQTDYEHYICFGYYKLKNNAAALQACTETIGRDPSNLFARYWRGVVLDETGEKDKALADLKIVAESENKFRGSAAIHMSMIYFGRNDLKGALAVLNRYTYLYNPDLGSKEDAAIGYNNRCYAYMELGDLEKALADCRQSLKYGNVPDAYSKEKELVKRLGLPETPASPAPEPPPNI